MHVITGIEIKGISTRYPKEILTTDDYVHFTQDEAEKFNHINSEKISQKQSTFNADV